MCVLNFSTTFIWNVSHSKNKWARHCHKYENVFVQSTRYYCQILMKLDVSWRIFGKSSNIKFDKSLSSGSRVFPYGQTDMKLIVSFRNFAHATKNWGYVTPNLLGLLFSVQSYFLWSSGSVFWRHFSVLLLALRHSLCSDATFLCCY